MWKFGKTDVLGNHVSFVVGRRVDLGMSLSPGHGNKSHHGARGVKVADGIKAANHLPSGWGESPVVSRCAQGDPVSL